MSFAATRFRSGVSITILSVARPIRPRPLIATLVMLCPFARPTIQNEMRLRNLNGPLPAGLLAARLRSVNGSTICREPASSIEGPKVQESRRGCSGFRFSRSRSRTSGLDLHFALDQGPVILMIESYRPDLMRSVA